MTYRTVKLASTVPPASLQAEPERRVPVAENSREGHLDKALDRSKVDRFEDAIELWKIYGES